MKNTIKRIIAVGLVMSFTFFTLPTATFAVDTPSSWAVEQVNTAITENIVPQSLQSNYTQAITRAEFCTLAVELFEVINGEITRRTTFIDTNDLNVEKAAAIGIISGIGDNKFNPNGTLTREQAAVMLSNLSDAIGQPFPKQVTTFADNGDITSWAIESVGRVQAVGIMNGVGDNRFAPQQPYTREQSIVTFIQTLNFMNNGKRSSTPQQDIMNIYKKAPLLEVSLISGRNPMQSIPLQSFQAAQLATSWSYVDENGSGGGYEHDSPHPLQLSDYSEFTLYLDHTGDQILIQFINGNPPQSVSVQRWNAKYYTGIQDISNILDMDESVEIDGNILLINDYGNDYIYEVRAT